MATAQKIKLRAYEKAFKHELYNIAYLLFYSLRAHFSGPPANEIFWTEHFAALKLLKPSKGASPVLVPSS